MPFMRRAYLLVWELRVFSSAAKLQKALERLLPRL